MTLFSVQAYKCMNFNEVDMETLLDLFPYSIYVLDTMGQIQWVNRHLKEQTSIFNSKAFQSLSLDHLSGFLGWNRELLSSMVQKNQEVLKNPMSINQEEEGEVRGMRRYFLTQRNPFYNFEGKLQGIVVLIYDITDQKVNEQLLAEKQLMTETLSSLKKLAASMAHELRTPLVGAKSGTLGFEKLFDKMSDKFQNQNNAIPQLVSNVISNMKTQMDQALMFVDLSSANFKINKIDNTSLSYLSMLEVIQEALQDYPYQVADRNLLEFDESLCQDFNFLGSLSLTKHVLYNLLRNAMFYARATRSGKVTLKVLNDSLGHRVIVRDTGPGIPPEILPKIFDLFFTNRELGTGIGLSFCRMVMHEYKGEILCESVLGEYTQFTLIFPSINSNFSATD